jgi:hypothetical protein
VKAYTLPAGRIPAIREFAQRMAGLTEPAEILKALHSFEAELVAMGGKFDSELSAAIAVVEESFPGSRFVEVKHVVH